MKKIKNEANFPQLFFFLPHSKLLLLFCIRVNALRGRGGFKHHFAMKSLLGLAIWPNQIAIQPGDTLLHLLCALQTASLLGNDLCWPAPLKSPTLNSLVKLASPSSCKAPTALATLVPGVTSPWEAPIRAAICMCST